MNFFFDNNLPKRLAHAIAVLDTSHRVVHLQDDNPANTPDEVWLEKLGHRREWNVISCDLFNKTKEEKAALSARARATFIFSGGYGNLPIWTQAYKVVQRWPEVLRASENARAGQVFRLHVKSNKVDDITHQYQ